MKATGKDKYKSLHPILMNIVFKQVNRILKAICYSIQNMKCCLQGDVTEKQTPHDPHKL